MDNDKEHSFNILCKNTSIATNISITNLRDICVQNELKGYNKKIFALQKIE